ncbi:MAG: hypothetical protein K6A23_04125 [Butyrivibrio sp.]|nr:hypothetical protein [Butyrivibrio sp.]
MKNWTTPEVKELEITSTAQGTSWTYNIDEIRFDKNGKIWASCSSGKDPK